MTMSQQRGWKRMHTACCERPCASTWLLVPPCPWGERAASWLNTQTLDKEIGIYIFAGLETRQKRMPKKLRVLVTGSGYIAQHVASALAQQKSGFDVTHSYRGSTAPWSLQGVSSVHLELRDSVSATRALWSALPDVIVHTAAISSLEECERDVELANATNCPDEFLEAMFAVVPDALLIQLSSDIVLSGREPREGPYVDGGSSIELAKLAIEAARPINTYGRSKLAFEQRLLAWPRCIIFRLSNVIGPSAPMTGGGKFAQKLAARLADESQPSVELWYDEARCFVDVRQVVAAITAAIENHAIPHEPASNAARVDVLRLAASKPAEIAAHERAARRTYPYVFLHLNLGGPQPLSRLDLGKALCEVASFDAAKLKSVSRTSAKQVYQAPLYVHLDSSNLQRYLGVKLIPIKEALAHALA